MERIKDIVFEAVNFGYLTLLILQMLLGARVLMLPALILAQDALNPVVAQQQINGLRDDLERHEGKLDELTKAVQSIAVQVAVLAQSRSSDDYSDKAILFLVLALGGERVFTRFNKKNSRKEPST